MESLKKYVYGLMVKAWRFAGEAWRSIWRVGKEDPRRVIHAFKVGLSLTLVSLLYLMEPLFKGIGSNAMWAVMTVVVVLEFTAGATLCKGLNRGLGTVVAGSLAFLMEFIATEHGKTFGAIFISAAVFVIGTAATFMRFFPDIKRNYDYGIVIFLLTFNLITVSSYRVDNVLKIAYDRFYTIAIGCGICLVMSLLLFPNWSGEELHNSNVSRLEGLATSVQACVSRYFEDDELDPDISKEEAEDDPIYLGYKAVLDSKSYDATLAKHASWEPRHSRHCYRYPWQQYVKLGAVLRRFGYTVVALHGCLETEIQTPRSVRALFRDPCTRLAGEVSKTLTELADGIRKRRQCSPYVISVQLHEALKDLNTALKSQPRLFVGSETNQTSNMLALAAVTARQSLDNHLPSANTEPSALHEWKLSKSVSKKTKEAAKKVLRPTLSKNAITSLEFSEALPFAAFASLLVETVARLDIVIEEVEELGRKANFKEFNPDDEISVTCERPKVETASNFNNNLPEQAAE